MYVIPIFTRTINESPVFTIKTCWVLLERNGTACIPIESVAHATAFSEENGILLLGPPRLCGNYVILDVDADATDLTGFYSWAEVLPNEMPLREVWRPFIWRESKIAGEDTWGTNTFLNSVDCSPESIGQILTTYFKT